MKVPILWRDTGAPAVSCIQAAEITFINQTLYCTTDKVKLDATLLSYIDITPVKHRIEPKWKFTNRGRETANSTVLTSDTGDSPSLQSLVYEPVL